jgi:hypothetical protein
MESGTSSWSPWASWDDTTLIRSDLGKLRFRLVVIHSGIIPGNFTSAPFLNLFLGLQWSIFEYAGLIWILLLSLEVDFLGKSVSWAERCFEIGDIPRRCYAFGSHQFGNVEVPSIVRFSRVYLEVMRLIVVGLNSVRSNVYTAIRSCNL